MARLLIVTLVIGSLSPGLAQAEEKKKGVMAVVASAVLRSVLPSYFPRDNPSADAKKAALDAFLSIQAGKYDQGMESLSKAIAFNPKDAGRDFDLRDRSGDISPKAMEHGRKQVRRMLRDRPKMALHAPDALCEWAARKFAGEDLGHTIDWSSEIPHPGTTAQHFVPGPLNRGRIQLRLDVGVGDERGRKLSFEELWSGAVFELVNISNAKDFRRVDQQLQLGRLDRDSYYRAHYAIEFKAAQKTRAFYCYVFLPWAKNTGFKSDPVLWYGAMWEDFDYYVKLFSESSYHEHIMRTYDQRAPSR